MGNEKICVPLADLDAVRCADLRQQQPYDVGGAVVGLEVQLVERCFEVGDPIALDTNDLAWICWTLFTCGRNLAEALEKRGRELGVEFTESATREHG